MSLIPLLTEINPISDVEDLLDDTFGLGIHPLDIFRPYQRSLLKCPLRHRRPYVSGKYRTGRGKLDTLGKYDLVPQVGKDGFQVCMDVSQFSPNELSVKTVDRSVIVEGKHEEREDEHGLIQRHFIRKYLLPKGYDPKDVVSMISSDGVLTVKTPPPPNKSKNERIIQIQQTGPAHLNIKEPEESAKTKQGGENQIKTK